MPVCSLDTGHTCCRKTGRDPLILEIDNSIVFSQLEKVPDDNDDDDAQLDALFNIQNSMVSPQVRARQTIQ